MQSTFSVSTLATQDCSAFVSRSVHCVRERRASLKAVGKFDAAATASNRRHGTAGGCIRFTSEVIHRLGRLTEGKAAYRPLCVWIFFEFSHGADGAICAALPLRFRFDSEGPPTGPFTRSRRGPDELSARVCG